jgi:hypothetical protein
MKNALLTVSDHLKSSFSELGPRQARQHHPRRRRRIIRQSSSKQADVVEFSWKAGMDGDRLLKQPVSVWQPSAG